MNLESIPNSSAFCSLPFLTTHTLYAHVDALPELTQLFELFLGDDACPQMRNYLFQVNFLTKLTGSMVRGWGCSPGHTAMQDHSGSRSEQ